MPSRKSAERNRERLGRPESNLSTRGTILEGERFPRSFASEEHDTGGEAISVRRRPQKNKSS